MKPTTLPRTPASAENPPIAQFGTVVIGIPLVLTAIRCTLQYILVPFVLPLLGVSSTFSPLANMAAGLFSVGVILYNLKTLWNTSWRKRYLLIACLFVPFILVSVYFDLVAYRGM
jgi:uncharacterized membrane protein